MSFYHWLDMCLPQTPSWGLFEGKRHPLNPVYRAGVKQTFMNVAKTDAQGDREACPSLETLLSAHGGSTASVYSVGVYYLFHRHVAFSRDSVND